MRVSGGASNLINGVSRQSPDVRLTTQLEESVNQWPPVTRGLTKRNPALLVGLLPFPREKALLHLIERDGEEKYVAEIGGGGVRVWDLKGNRKVVNAPDGFDYVNGSGEASYQAVTVADHTFILNKEVRARKEASRTPAMRQQALVHLVQGSFHTTYTISINGAVAAKFSMGGGPWGDDEWVRLAERQAKTDAIAQALLNGRTLEGAALTAPEGILTVHSTLSASLSSSEWTVTRLGNVLHILNRLGNDFEIEASATDPNLIRAHKESSPVYAELPNKAPNGFALKINGDDDSSHDDYFVVFDKPEGTAAGRWKETHAPDTQNRLNVSTMPHLLVREEDGTFTFKPATWETRKVGDDETNPWPSFVGQRIAGLVYAQNRLVLFSGESVALSRHNSSFDFFKESLLSRLDTDPVDLTIAHPEVSTILHAVPMGDEIVLFTTSVQFRLSAGGDRLTNDNGSIKPILSVSARSAAVPVSLGSRLYFVNDAPSGSFVTEFLYDREAGLKAEEDISSHVQGYLPGAGHMLTGDKDLRTLVLIGKDSPEKIFVYRWMVSGNERLQSAWQHWTIPGISSFRAAKVMGEELIVVATAEERAEVLSVNLHEGWTQGLTRPVLLDRQVTVAGTYDADTLQTRFTLPHRACDDVFDISEDSFGTPVEPEWSPSRASFTLEGDWTGRPVIAGAQYESYGVLSPLLYRTQNNQGAYGNAVPGFETTVSSVAFGSASSAFLEVEVARRYREPFRVVLSPAQLNSLAGRAGAQEVGRVHGTVSVMARSDDVTITFGAATAHPYTITGLSWNGSAYPVSF